MLTYDGYIPTISGSAFVPGGTGILPVLLYSGYQMTSRASFPIETWGRTISVNVASGFDYNSGGYGVSHGFEQKFGWDGYLKDVNGNNKYIIPSGWNISGIDYQRFNYGNPIVTTSNYLRKLQSNILTAVSGSNTVLFNITSMQYKVKSDYIYEGVHIPYDTYKDTARCSAKLSIGGFNVIDSSDNWTLDSYGPVNIIGGFRISSNYYVGSVNPGLYWSGSSNTINSDSFNIKYNYTLLSKRSLQSYNTFNTKSWAASHTTSYFNHMSIYATAYGDVYKYY